MSARPQLLLFEDDGDVARLVAFQLELEGFAVTVNATGGGALEQVAALRPQLVILDLMLPLAHGFEILRDLRRDPRYAQLPVLLLTALGSEDDRVRGFDLGADDYVQKPFSPRELAARVRARLRTAPEPPSLVLRAGSLALRLDPPSAFMEGKPLDLSDTEFRLLAFLMKAPGRTFTRAQIIAAVWSPQHFITTRAVDVYMLRLRAKIEPNPEQPQWLVSVRRIGYRFDTPRP